MHHASIRLLHCKNIIPYKKFLCVGRMADGAYHASTIGETVLSIGKIFVEERKLLVEKEIFVGQQAEV